MAKCSFCNKDIELGTGLTYVRNDGKIFRFDARKCERAMIKFGRDPRNVTWIKKDKTRK